MAYKFLNLKIVMCIEYSLDIETKILSLYNSSFTTLLNTSLMLILLTSFSTISILLTLRCNVSFHSILVLTQM